MKRWTFTLTLFALFLAINIAQARPVAPEFQITIPVGTPLATLAFTPLPLPTGTPTAPTPSPTLGLTQILTPPPIATINITPLPIILPTQPFNTNPLPIYVVPQSIAIVRLNTLQLGTENLDAPNAILDTIDAALPAVWTQIVTLQNYYFEQTNATTYIQGLPSHSVPPSDGENQFPDLFLTAPTDFPASWFDTNLLPYSPSPYLYRMDTYTGPYGPGFTFCVQVTLAGETFEKCHNYGGEIWRAHDWTLLETN